MIRACFSSRKNRLKEALCLTSLCCVVMVIFLHLLLHPPASSPPPVNIVGSGATVGSETISSEHSPRFVKKSDTGTWDWPNDLSCPARPHRDDRDVVQSCSTPILTMFTAMHESDERREKIHNNTIINWSSLGSCVQLILYLNDTDTELAHFARDNKWRVELIPHAAYDIPVLSSMFLSSFNLGSTPLYLYANSDILFDFSLVNTIRALLCALHVLKNTELGTAISDDVDKVRAIHGGIFAVGRRTNVNLTDVKSAMPEDMASLGLARKLFSGDAQDYFITTSGREINFKNSKPDVGSKNERSDCGNDHSCHRNRTFLRFSQAKERILHLWNNSKTSNISPVPLTPQGHFPWDRVPNFVIGRPGYDNWLVAQAVRWNVTLSVDLTKTVLAIHQTGNDGIYSGFLSPDHNLTVCVNYRIAGREFVYQHGLTGCVHWLSSHSLDGSMIFVARDNIDPICTKVSRLRKSRKKSLCWN